MRPRGRGTSSGSAPGALHVVATPLGNLGDITRRAIEALARADLVACEDTRRTRALLTHLGLRTRTLSHHKFNEASRIRQILAALREGRNVALVTDAGTPGVSDPGARLVSAVHRAGLPVVAVPGPSAPVAALSVSGFEAAGFVFAGYPPARRAARRRFLRAVVEAERARAGADPAGEAWPLVFFEAPHRVEASLEDLRAVVGERRAVLVREMTKIHEETIQGTISDLLAAVREGRGRGEFTIVMEGGRGEAPDEEGGPIDLREAYEELLGSGLDRREALRRLARSRGMSRREIYRLLAVRDREGE